MTTVTVSLKIAPTLGELAMKSRLTANYATARHPLCVGFDPDTKGLPDFLAIQSDRTPPENFITRWYESVLNSCESAHSIKFQSAFFERLGSTGIAILKDLITDARRRGLFTILDAKRGDISSTMAAYGDFAYGYMGADALTVLPWMGSDTLDALSPWLRQGKGTYVVWLSSNPSGRELQTTKTLEGTTVAGQAYRLFRRKAEDLAIAQQVGWVLGATDLSQDFLREMGMADEAFLCPGVGAQGARLDKNSMIFHARHPASLFPVSRGLTTPAQGERITSWEDYGQMVKARWSGLVSDWKSGHL